MIPCVKDHNYTICWENVCPDPLLYINNTFVDWVLLRIRSSEDFVCFVALRPKSTAMVLAGLYDDGSSEEEM